MNKYGQVIAKLRKQKGLTQEQLGNLLYVSSQAVSKWENGLAEPSLETIEQLTEIFGISVHDFFAMAQGKESSQSIEPRHSAGEPNQVATKTVQKSFLSSHTWYLIAGLIVVIIALVMCVVLIPANRTSNQIYNQYEAAVFRLDTRGEHISKSGAGFFVDNSGLALTTFSNIKDCSSGEIKLSNGETYEISKIIGVDTNIGLALIKVEIDRNITIPLGNSNNVKLGDKVYAMTYSSDDDEESVIVEGMVYKVESDSSGVTSIQTTASIANAYRGGILFNEQGKAIGVISGELRVSGVGMDIVNVCIPINKLNGVDRDLNATFSEFFDKCNTLNFYYNESYITYSKDYISGDIVEPIDDPNRTGYIFGGWYTDTTYQQEFDFSTPLTTETACYAKWTPITYTVRFDANGAYGTMADVVLNYGEWYALPACTYTQTGYAFTGWRIGEDGKTIEAGTKVNNITENDGETVTLFATWEMISYTLVFDGNDATSGEMIGIVVRYNQPVVLPLNAFVRTGYIFSGWSYNNKMYNAGESVSKLRDTVGQATIMAQWAPITYTVRFVYANQEPYTQEFTYDEPQKLYPNRFTKPYFKFAYWRDNVTFKSYYDEKSVVNLTAENGAIVELTAMFNQYIYTLRFHKENVVDLETCVTESYGYSSNVSMHDRFSGKTGYLFSHYIDSNGNVYAGTMCKLTDIDGAVIDLFAVWEELSYTAYYRYEHKGKTNIYPIGTLTYEEEFTLTEPVETYDGYEFSYYFYEVYRYTFNVGDTASKLSVWDKVNIYIDAIYTPKTFAVVFNGNGATSGNMDSITATFDSNVIIPENAYKRDKYVFAGWEFNGEIYTNLNLGTLISTYQDSVTLNAQWIKNIDGTGTSLDPYKISNVDDLDTFATISQITQYENEYVMLNNDINCEFKKLKPVTFRGIFDGRGHKLINVDYEGIGLFSNNYGYIKNLAIENLVRDLTDDDAVDGRIRVAGLAYENHGYIDRCSVTGSITVNTTLPVSIAGMVLVNYLKFDLPGVYFDYFNPLIQNSYVDIDADVIATSDISYFYFDGLSGGFNDITHNYTIVDLKASLMGVENMIVDVYGAKDEHSFSQANINITATSCTEFTLDQNVAYYTSDSTIKLTIGGREVPKLITTTTNVENLKNKEWMESNLFEVPNVWLYDGENFPTPSTTYSVVIDTQEEFEELFGQTLYSDYILNCDIDLTDVRNCMIGANFGKFDGNGHTVYNFNPHTNEYDLEYGLFLKNYGTIKNLRLVNVDVNLGTAKGGTAGALVAENYSLVEACYAEGSVHCNYITREVCVGGLVGRSYGGIVRDSYINMSVGGGIKTKPSEENFPLYFGGITGAGTGLIERCYTLGSVESYAHYADGTHDVFLAGIANGDIVVRDCFTMANIKISDKYEAIGIKFCMESISANAENCFAYEWQELNYLDEITYEGTISYTTMCSAEFWSGLHFTEFIDQENLAENSDAVWVFNVDDLPTLWFDIQNQNEGMQ